VVTATASVCAFDVSATLVALIFTVDGCGCVAGALYTPEVLMVPTAAPPPWMPFTVQITPVFVLPVTVATYFDEFPSITLAAPLRLTDTTGAGGVGGGAIRLTARLCDLEESATLAAVIVTVPVLELFAGAV
jgi:hypothetical protein